MMNDDLAGEVKRTEQDQEEGPENKTSHSSRRVKNSKSTENQKETEKSISMIETDTGKFLKKFYFQPYTLHRGKGDPRSCF